MNIRSKLLMTVLCFATVAAFGQKNKKGDVFKVFYLGGQSNMDGYGYTKDLPDSLDKTFDDVYIFQGNSAPDGDTSGGKGIWEKLKPGHGVFFSSDGEKNKLSDRFGVEMSFAYAIKQMYPNDKIAIIKYSRGGTSIDSVGAGNSGAWEPDFNGLGGINQYDHFLATLRNATANQDINGDGKIDTLVPQGIVWMQGESDGDKGEEVALRYYDHLKRMMDLVRAALRYDDLPVVIGKISDSWNDKKDGKVWDYGDLIQYAEEKFAREDGNAAIVRTTRYYKYSDPWHYTSVDYIDLGVQFANAWKSIQ